VVVCAAVAGCICSHWISYPGAAVLCFVGLLFCVSVDAILPRAVCIWYAGM